MADNEIVIRWYGEAWEGADTLEGARKEVRRQISEVRKGNMAWFLDADDIDPEDPYFGFSITEHDGETGGWLAVYDLTPTGALKARSSEGES
jgi:hypothetical protein